MIGDDHINLHTGLLHFSNRIRGKIKQRMRPNKKKINFVDIYLNFNELHGLHLIIRLHKNTEA